MKHLLKLMIMAALGAFVINACQEKQDSAPVEKPVVTADMYSVTVNTKTGEVTFKFTENDLNPYWTVTNPNGVSESFYDREVTKKYEIPGLYAGKISAFGAGGESDPVDFTFNPLGEVDNSLSSTENILISQPWKPYDIIYYGGEGETYWEWDSGEVPGIAADDRLTFHKDGKFVLDLGEHTEIYNDMVDGGIHPDPIVLTGNEKWAYVKEGAVEYIQFSDGGFPGMLADEEGINGKYELRNVSANKFELHYYQAAQEQSLCFVFVSESFVDEPVDNGVTEQLLTSALAGKTLYVSRYGWWGEGWDYFDDPIPATTMEDRITFNADGSLVIDLGEDLTIYHDSGWRINKDEITDDSIKSKWEGETEYWQVTGNETWAVKSDVNGVYVKFANGGFPLMCASSNVEGPDYNLGVDGKWTVESVEEGTVRMSIYQSWNEQWFTVFLTPIE